METLYALIVGFVGGILGALGIDFVRTPFRQFFTLRTEIRHEMLRLANVGAPDPSWTYPTYTQEALDRLLGPSREAQRTFRNLGTRMMAFGETERIAAKCVRLLGYEPLEAARGLIGLSNAFPEYGPERAAHRARINKALRFPD
jgi:hypothetical protein